MRLFAKWSTFGVVFLARLLCLAHVGLSIYLLYAGGQNSNLVYLVPILGAALLIVEAAFVWVAFDGEEPTTRCVPTVLFVYVPTIVGCCWCLEIESVKNFIRGL